MGYCLYGNDIDDTTSPLEAGLGWITKFNHNFVNSQNLEKQKEQGPAKRLVGIAVEGRNIPRRGYNLLDPKTGEVVGRLTSGSVSPITKQGIGLGYVQTGYHQKGTPLAVAIRKIQAQATVVRPPFITQKEAEEQLKS